jgi:hypothetical protein
MNIITWDKFLLYFFFVVQLVLLFRVVLAVRNLPLLHTLLKKEQMYDIIMKMADSQHTRLLCIILEMKQPEL